MDDFTAANIAVSDEKREEELEKVKRGKVDYSKLEAEVEEAKSNALEVCSSKTSAYHCASCEQPVRWHEHCNAARAVRESLCSS